MFGDPNYLDLKDFTSLRHYATCISYFKIIPSLSGFIRWQGYYKSYNNEKFYSAGININLSRVFHRKPPKGDTQEEDMPNGKSTRDRRNGLGNNVQDDKPASVPLTLTKVIHLQSSAKDSFELSGLASMKNRIYAVFDDKKDIYEIGFKDNSFSLNPKVNKMPLPLAGGSTSLEGIDVCDRLIYFIDEKNPEVIYMYNLTDNTVKTSTVPGSILKKVLKGNNDDFEGIAYDCNTNTMYLAKERNIKTIFRFNIQSGQVYNDITFNTDSDDDISDIKFHNGFLYILERKKQQITKYNVQNNTIDKYTYTFLETTTNKGEAQRQMFNGSNESFGYAEALLIKNDKIYIGFDKNRETALRDWFISKYTSKGATKYGHPTIILEFNKPKEF